MRYYRLQGDNDMDIKIEGRNSVRCLRLINGILAVTLAELFLILKLLHPLAKSDQFSAEIANRRLKRICLAFMVV